MTDHAKDETGESKLALTHLLSATAASVTWVIQYRDSGGRWVDRDDIPATDEVTGIGNVTYLRKQINAPLRLVKRFLFDCLIDG